jgi:hexosaminidase
MLQAKAQQTQHSASINIIPIPVSVQRGMGSFLLQPTAKSGYTNNKQVQAIGQQMQQKIARSTGYSLAESKNIKDATIQLQFLNNWDTLLGKEGYRLNVTPTNVLIQANAPAGIYYGVQSFWQLLPAAIESKSIVNHKKWQVPEVNITDYPRFEWRGLMFNVARHFFT